MHLNHSKNYNINNSTVLIFPAQTPLWKDKELFFLFSIRQVITVFEPSQYAYGSGNSDWICGTARFQGNDMPIIAPEKCLGLPLIDKNGTQSVVAVREVYKETSQEFHEVYALFKLSASMRRLQLPLECHPIPVPPIIHSPSFLKGVYEMQKTILLVVHLRQIVAALAVPEEAAAHGI